MSLAFSWWYILICFLFAGAFSFLFYYFNNNNSKILIKTLFICRFFIFFSLAFFLLEPIIKYASRKVEKPIIVIAQDNSASLLKYSDSLYIKNNYKNDLNLFINTLKNKFDVKLITFGNDIVENGILDFKQKRTNIYNAFKEIDIRYNQSNIGAIVLASDGNFNVGENIYYNNFNFNAPIYSLIIGDTIKKKDASISQIINNEISYLGNDLPVEITINAQNLLNNSTFLTVKNNGNIVFTKSIKVENIEFYKKINFNLKANVIGVQKFEVILSKTGNEQNIINNTSLFYVDVIDTKQKIALFASSPHPDVKALLLALQSKDQFEVTLIQSNNLTTDFNKFNIVILHGYPNGDINTFNTIKKNILAANIPALFILGSSTNITQWNQLTTGFEIITQTKNTLQEATASVNANFNLFNVEQNIAEQITKWPPLYVIYSNYKTSNDYNVFAYQIINGIKTTFPLIAFSNNANKKIAIINGEGLWSWRLSNFKETQTHNEFDAFFAKIIQLQTATTKRKTFNIETNKIILDGDPINFNAELYNNALELTSEPEATLKIIGTNKKEYNYTFNKNNNSYFLNAGSLSPDNYTYTATTSINEKAIYANGKFTVANLNAEDNVSSSNLQLMKSIANKYNGKLAYAKNINILAEEILKNENIKSKSYLDKSINDLINYKWICFLIIILLTLEWFIRKRNNLY